MKQMKQTNLTFYKKYFIFCYIKKVLKLFQIEKWTNGKKSKFHSLIPLKMGRFLKGISSVKLFYIKRLIIGPCLTYKKYFFLLTFWACFNHSSLNQMQTCHQTCLSNISIHAFFSLFHLNIIYTINLSCPTRVIRYLFLRIIFLSFQSHQIRILSAGSEMACNREGLSCISFP